jgi:hypothetical protein
MPTSGGPLVTTNTWCKILGIAPPQLAIVAEHREANTYALLLVALLEHGEPMTLAEVAARFDEVGIAQRTRALLSLQRCQPARAPVFREGDLYHLDPHHDELALWAFRLSLRPPRFVPVQLQVGEQAPRPSVDAVLTDNELDEAWDGANLLNWSQQRLAVAVLDASGGPLSPAKVVAAVTTRTRWHPLKADTVGFNRRNSAVHVLQDGRWAIAEDASAYRMQARQAVRDRVEMARRQVETRTPPDVMEQRMAESARRRAEHGAALARMSRALLVAFPPARPEAVALLDVGRHEIVTFVGDELAGLPAQLAAFDSLGAVNVRGLLRALEFDHGTRRLAELGPPQKTMKVNQRGRILKITTELLVKGSCGIARPFSDEKKLAAHLAKGDLPRLRDGLEANVKSLYALYEYGRLHGFVRLRWGSIDEMLEAPWSHRDEPRLYNLKESALEMNAPLEVIVGTAPAWEEPWSRVKLVDVQHDRSGWRTMLIDEDGFRIDDDDVQRARHAAMLH